MPEFRKIRKLIEESVAVKKSILDDKAMLVTLYECVEVIVKSLQNGGKVLFCGNGGSAADAQHLAAELSGRFFLSRKPLFAEILHGNSSFLTAVGNDFGYEEVFARGVEAQGRKGDVLVVLSTSGDSPNIVRAAERAQKLGLIVIGLTGETGGQMVQYCDYILKCPSGNTPRIQESHILLGHIICQLVEEKIFS